MTIQEHSRHKPNLTALQTDRISILEQIGKTSAANIKIRLLIEQLEKTTIAEIEKSFDNWVTQLPNRLSITSKKWYSLHSYWTSRDKLVSNYCYQFSQTLSTLLKQWVEEAPEKIVKSYSANIYSQLRIEFENLDNFKMCSLRRPNFIWHNCIENTRFNYQKSSYNYCMSSYNGNEINKRVSFFEGIQSLLIPTAIAMGAGLIARSTELHDRLKAQIIELGCAELKKTELPKVKKDLIEEINREVFTKIMSCADDGFKCAILQYESIFESLDKQIGEN